MKKLSLIMLTITLSACSNAPSDSAVKDAAIGGFGINDCKLITVENYQKVNGIAGNDGRSYQEEVKYTLKVLPLPDAQTIQQNLETKHTKDIKALEEAKEAQASWVKQHGGYYSPELFELDHAIVVLTPAVRDYAPYDYQGVQNEFKKTCPSASPEIAGFVVRGYGEKNEYFTGGFSQEFTKTLNMIKTDNGWVGAR